MVTVPHKMVGSERMLDNGSVGLHRFYCIISDCVCTLYAYVPIHRDTTYYIYVYTIYQENFTANKFHGFRGSKRSS